ncbi:hypothetical protein LJR219_003125 [Phenylobacterium sp. LjRoot219]|uniref:hypothetical protein n=1 Tax=Phenylobacterium sp. LjRoot219 TaxID=3342283 RepID=UPI003ECF2C21
MDQNPQPQNPLVARALALRADVERFEGRWRPMADAERCLAFSWEELERQLVELAPSDLQAELVHRLLARTKVYAQLKPPEMVLREILCVAALVLEDSNLDSGSTPS